MTSNPIDNTASTSMDYNPSNDINNLPDIKNVQEPDVVDKFNGVYYFESDHVALKNNTDYTNMLKTIAVLEAQRIKAISDLDVLHDKYREAQEHPIKFVDDLQKQVDLQLPKPQKVASLPHIDWNKYTENASFAGIPLNKHMTRWKSQGDDGIKSEVNWSAASSTSQDDVSSVMVRGRVKQEGKTDTFNKLWSVEEQQRLEQLLIEFPEEEVESQRFSKIAQALGTRSRQQVTSRIQKYFIKLAKAGLSIPGRTPTVYSLPKKGIHRHHKYQRFYQMPSTFLASHEPPVYMSDEDDTSHDASANMAASESPDISDEEDIAPELRHTPEYQQLMKLKQLRKRQVTLTQTQNFGYKCDRCGMEPIIGIMWHCIDCPTEESLDFCQACSKSGHETATHNSSHRLDPVEIPQTSTVIDTDYTQFQPHGYNYLDPNFMPAT